MSNRTIVIYSDNPVLQMDDDQNDVNLLVISPTALRDFDYASSMIVEVLQDNTLDGPQQMQLAIDFASHFLQAHQCAYEPAFSDNGVHAAAY